MPLILASSLSRGLRQGSSGITEGYATIVTGLAGGGPMAYWRRLNTSTTINDVIGTRHAAVTGAAVAVPGLPLNSDDGIDFGGVASATVPHDPGLVLAAFTLSFWFSPTTMLAGVDPTSYTLFSKETGVGNNPADLQIVYSENGGSLRVTFQDGTVNHNWVSADGTVTENAPHHVLLRADSGGIEASLNGQDVPKASPTTMFLTLEHGPQTRWTSALRPVRFRRTRLGLP